MDWSRMQLTLTEMSLLTLKKWQMELETDRPVVEKIFSSNSKNWKELYKIWSHSHKTWMVIIYLYNRNHLIVIK